MTNSGEEKACGIYLLENSLELVVRIDDLITGNGFFFLDVLVRYVGLLQIFGFYSHVLLMIRDN